MKNENKHLKFQRKLSPIKRKMLEPEIEFDVKSSLSISLKFQNEMQITKNSYNQQVCLARIKVKWKLRF